ncbi:MspA family porin, partial [Nocardia sp. NPDC058497]|uniref:MspA family porin n=1 Tax=Nocardia sp. NPDC058497 TaxID=3346529 RepID=UPI003661EF07
MRDTTSRRNRGMRRMLTVATAAMIGLTLGHGGATAEVIDSQARIVDSADRTVNVIQKDTLISFVPPLDGNPTTREWFHDGTAAFRIDGPDADKWEGKIIIGYQVGYPASFDGKLKFEWMTPGLEVESELSNGAVPSVTIDSLIPQAGIELEVGLGPGIETIEAAEGEISGGEGFIRLHGFHGTVTGVGGP